MLLYLSELVLGYDNFIGGINLDVFLQAFDVQNIIKIKLHFLLLVFTNI